MDYIAGDIIGEKHTKFKGTNQIDTHLSDRPVLLPVNFGFDDDFIYYFTLGSDLTYYTNDPDRYEIISMTGLKKTSLVDLKYVYKKRKSMKNVKDNLQRDLLAKLIEKHKTYIHLCKDDDCQEMHKLL